MYEKLWQLCNVRDIKPIDLSELCGISISTIHAMQHGNDVRMDVLRKLCRGLGVDVGEILSLNGQVPVPATRIGSHHNNKTRKGET